MNEDASETKAKATVVGEREAKRERGERKKLERLEDEARGGSQPSECVR